MKVSYIRVSTIDQNESRQIEGLKKFDIEKVFMEKVSAKDTNRPELQKALDFVREGDTLYVHDFSRLARSTRDLLDIVDILDKKGVNLVSNKENIDTHTASGKLMITMIAAINEFERSNLLERQREGIAIAKSKGLYKGRKEVKIDNFNEHYRRYINREVNKVQLSKELKISRNTLDKLIKEYEKSGIIAGYKTLINWESAGKEIVTALIEVKIIPQRGVGFDSVAERIYKFEHVKSCYLMSSGGFDVMVTVEGKSMKEIASFVSEKLACQEYVSGTATHFVLKKYKEHGIIYKEEKIDDREDIFI